MIEHDIRKVFTISAFEAEQLKKSCETIVTVITVGIAD